MELDHLISDKKEQHSASEFRKPQLHAAKPFKRKRPLADDRIGKYRKIRVISPPNGLLTGGKTVSYSRLPRDDELYVNKAFTRHASHCSTCANSHETYRKGDKLGSKGYQRALDACHCSINKFPSFDAKFDANLKNDMEKLIIRFRQNQEEGEFKLCIGSQGRTATGA